VPFPAPKKPAASLDTVDAPLSKGAFFAQGRAMVDARREHLARMGLDPRHVEALQMPKPDAVEAPPVHADAIPAPAQAAAKSYQPKTLPPLAGVTLDVGERE